MRGTRTRTLVVIFGVALGLVLPCLAANTTITYTFNTADQLTQVSSSDYGTLASFTYDGEGQRITKTVGSQTTIYVRGDAGEVIAEYSGTGTLLAEYVYLDGQRVCKITKDAQGVEHRVYYHADIVGTPVVLTDESGNLISKAEYYPFGEEVVPGAAPDLHMFTGKEMDDETGLYYFGARYYDSELGRFISVDPVGGKGDDPQSWNRYAYGRNNPLRFVDLTGLDWLEYTGQKVTWYGGTPGDRSQPAGTWAAASGYRDSQTDLQSSSQTGQKAGPIPSGRYSIRLGPDPNRVAGVDPSDNGNTLYHPEGGIQRLPEDRTIPVPGHPGYTYGYAASWGTIRAYLDPDAENDMHGRFPADRFYLHNSSKGFTHGCVETSTQVFDRLLEYRNNHAAEESFSVWVNYTDATTGGSTKQTNSP